MNREEDFAILSWEGDEYIISFKGRIIGQTLHKSTAFAVKRWIGTALDSILAIEALEHGEMPGEKGE